MFIPGTERDIIEYADLVTEMQEVKHPLQKHKDLTEGIDY
ncbi:MAG: cob(I)yrinic acid a,c-diamide adenosyltransferase [Candidatus Marinimicrobia bacterium]|nr:cob(I)yrinic acid a,c-diamide adenosyltransferase [Candidatus Neomarinimicrobiota bacterium]